jgi:hypothetical protein
MEGQVTGIERYRKRNLEGALEGRRKGLQGKDQKRGERKIKGRK